jgi:hypothetical protein
MDSFNDFIEEISLWKDSLGDSNSRYDLAFLKIYIKFEVLMSDIFLLYASGKPSEFGFTPQRRLSFDSEEHIRKIFSYGKSYTDYLSLIEKHNIYKEIFTPDTDPFNLIFSDPVFNTEFMKMRLLRNYITHESKESKYLYESKVLKTYSWNSYLHPSDFLQKKCSHKSQYTIYGLWINLLQKNSKILLDPTDFLK